MHQFDPNISIKANYQKSSDMEFAAWELAGHDHQEKYRDSGQSPQRTAWLHWERIGILKDALANGELLALGIESDDPYLEIIRIPENLFLAADFRSDGDNLSISGAGRKFIDVQICRAIPGIRAISEKVKSNGRPSHLLLIKEAWEKLKSEIPEFLDWDKASQNREIREKVSALFPGKFPGNSRIGATTIRRHRSKHPEMFD